jgi:hypothetical protein
MSEAQPTTPFSGAPVDALERVQSGGVDELQGGEIDNEAHRSRRARFEVTVEQGRGRSVKRTGKPDDRRGS